MAAGQEALAQRNYEQAIKQAEEALVLSHGGTHHLRREMIIRLWTFKNPSAARGFVA